MTNLVSKKCALIGYPCDLGGTILGSREGPRVFRDLGLQHKLEKLGWNASDLGDALSQMDSSAEEQITSLASSEEKKTKNLALIYKTCSQLADLTRRALENKSIPIILGGDHSLSIGSVAAVSNFYKKTNNKIGLIWIDTHPDINTPATSPSMALFGMSTAVLTGQIPGVLSSIHRENTIKATPSIDLNNLVFVGLRDVDSGEKKFIKEKQIQAFTIKEIDILGMAEVIKRAIELASKDTCGFVVSFDLDVCDPQLVPGTGTPVRGGLSFREAHLTLEMIYDSQKMLALELVELNPILDRSGTTADFAISLIESAFGKQIL